MPLGTAREPVGSLAQPILPTYAAGIMMTSTHDARPVMTALIEEVTEAENTVVLANCLPAVAAAAAL
jgi:hypothetical protein